MKSIFSKICTKTYLIFAFSWIFLGTSKCKKVGKDENIIYQDVFEIVEKVQVGQAMRAYKIHLPKQYFMLNKALPLVFVFHGGGGSASNIENQTGLSAKADLENFVVVYPEGTPKGLLNLKTWNAGNCCAKNDEDDIAFVDKMIAELPLKYKIDKNKIYATGHSNGAMLCYRIANELSTKIAAIAPNAGNFQLQEAYNPERNVPVIHIHSKLDNNVTFTGGIGSASINKQYNTPIDSCLDVISKRATCNSNKKIVVENALFTYYKWNACGNSDFEIDYYLTEDGGHSWPGGNKGSAMGDEPSKAFNNNDIIWSFFKKHSIR